MWFSEGAKGAYKHLCLKIKMYRLSFIFGWISPLFDPFDLSMLRNFIVLQQRFVISQTRTTSGCDNTTLSRISTTTYSAFPPRFICEHFLRTVVIYRPGKGEGGNLEDFGCVTKSFTWFPPPSPPQGSLIFLWCPLNGR